MNIVMSVLTPFYSKQHLRDFGIRGLPDRLNQ